MPELSDIFGEGKLSYEEFLVKAGEAGAEFGDTAALRADYEERIRDLATTAALERELDRAAVRNRDVVSRLIDFSAVTVDENGVHGITEQVASLRQSDPYLFADPAPRRPIRSGLPHAAAPTDPDSLDDAAYYKMRAAKS